MRKRRYKYDVALSFAEEDRHFVEPIADQLRDLGIRVFYDAHQRIWLWGKILDVILDQVYREEARLCIAFVSADYKRKHWTQFEKHHALARSYYNKGKEYLLLYRLDDTDVEGLPTNVAHFSKETAPQSELANTIAIKIKQNRDDDIRVWLNMRDFVVKRRWWLAAATLVAIGIGFDLGNRLTPVDTLTKSFYERSGHSFAVAVCRDGKLSRSRGAGTCSGHGGVDHYADTVLFLKTTEQCRQDAEKISWW